MKAFYDLNRLLCRCLEVMNILLALPFGALIYVVSADYIRLSIANSDIQYNLQYQDATINIIAIILALISILFVNGTIAQALDKRRFLEDIANSVNDPDAQSTQGKNRKAIRIAKTLNTRSASKKAKPSSKKKALRKNAVRKKAAKGAKKGAKKGARKGAKKGARKGVAKRAKKKT